MMKKITQLVWLALVLAIMSSCSKMGAEYVDELDVTVTNFDPEFNFDRSLTYAMDDTIVHIKNGEENEDVDRTFDDEILAQLESHMEDQGYTKVEIDPNDPNNKPDFVVLVSAIVDENYGYYWWGYPGWGYYPGWGQPGWGYPGYPSYPWWGYPVAYSYTTGTLLVEYADLASPMPSPIDPDVVIYPVYFRGAVNGLLQGSDAYISKRLEIGMDDMFSQAPFEN